MSQPTVRDAKRLFALSGNRCAFPKCQISIAEGASLVGEICHIKGDKVGAARYDEAQTDEQRQAFENLLLMCGTHHKVIDDDEISYTVERLIKIKADHEVKALVISETAESNSVVTLLIENSSIITGQSGGLAAHTVNAQTINLHAAVGGAPNEKGAEAKDTLWAGILALKATFGRVIFFDTILLPAELDEFFKGKSDHNIFGELLPYRDKLYVAQEMTKVLPENAERCRLHVSKRLWALYQVATTLLGRSAMLLTLSFKEQTLKDWRSDSIIDQYLRSVLPAALIDAQKQAETGGIQRLLSLLENAYLEEARASKT